MPLSVVFFQFPADLLIAPYANW